MSPTRIVALTLVALLPILFLAPDASAGIVPAAGGPQGFEPDDKEKLARISKQLAKMKGNLQRLEQFARTAKEQGRVEAARAAARRLAIARRQFQALEQEARALKARFYKTRRAVAVRKPIRTRTQKKATVNRTIRTQPGSRYTLARRAVAARAQARKQRTGQSKFTARTWARGKLTAPAPAAAPADRYVRIERAYLMQIAKLAKDSAALEKKLGATKAGLMRAKKGLDTLRRAKAARARLAAGQGVSTSVAGRYRASAASAGSDVVNELRLLRRDVRQLTQTMQAFLAQARKTHAAQFKADAKRSKKTQAARKAKYKVKARAKQPVRKQPKAKRKSRRSVTFDDRFSL